MTCPTSQHSPWGCFATVRDGSAVMQPGLRPLNRYRSRRFHALQALFESVSGQARRRQCTSGLQGGAADEAGRASRAHVAKGKGRVARGAPTGSAGRKIIMSNPAAIPGQSHLARPEVSDELDLLSAVLRCGACVEGGRAAAAGLLREFGGLAGVSAADPSALARAGLTVRAAAEIGRARSLALAMARAEACRRPVLSSWTALITYLRATMAHAPREQFRVLYLDKRNILMREEHLAHGTVDHAPVYVREVVRRALEMSASAMILAHNHPSGDPTPSQADIDMTRRIIDAASVFDIQVHDHVIVGREGNQSFRALGLI